MQFAMVMMVLIAGFIHAICYGNDRTYSPTCLVNIPAFKRVLVLKKNRDNYLEVRFLNLVWRFLSGNEIFKF